MIKTLSHKIFKTVVYALMFGFKRVEDVIKRVIK